MVRHFIQTRICPLKDYTQFFDDLATWFGQKLRLKKVALFGSLFSSFFCQGPYSFFPFFGNFSQYGPGVVPILTFSPSGTSFWGLFRGDFFGSPHFGVRKIPGFFFPFFLPRDFFCFGGTPFWGGGLGLKNWPLFRGFFFWRAILRVLGAPPGFFFGSAGFQCVFPRGGLSTAKDYIGAAYIYTRGG